MNPQQVLSNISLRYSLHHAKTVLRLAASLLVALVLLPGAQQLQAGTVDVTVTPTASGPGLVSMSYNNTTNALPGNDNVAGSSSNLLAINQKAFGSVDVIDIVFTVIDTGAGTTEYMLTEGVDNGTGIPWTDYHVELGFGTGASFVPSTPGDGLDFDAPDFDSPISFGPFTSITYASEDQIDVDGGIFPIGAFFVLAFPIDVPDGISTFTLRQLPTIAVPEPSTFVLALFGLLALGGYGRSRRRS